MRTPLPSRASGAARAFLLVLTAVAAAAQLFAAEHSGQVTFAEAPVPGATVTAIRGSERHTVTTDQEGIFRFADLAEGQWTIRVEMLGFAPLEREVTIPPGEPSPPWTLVLRSFDEIKQEAAAKGAELQQGAGAGDLPLAASLQTPQAASGPNANADRRTSSGTGGFQRAAVNAVPGGNSTAPPPPDDPPGDASAAADGFLINGSVNNGAATPFAQSAAFGNNRRRGGSLYNFALGVAGGTSVWDARPFSFTDGRAPKPDYNDIHVNGTFGGPVRIPGLRNRANVFVGYQRTADHQAITRSALMPTTLERAGDFSQSRNAFGQPVQIIDPLTGLPFEGNVVSPDRMSPQALALLNYYPLPNATGRYNYQAPEVTATFVQNVQTRFDQPLNNRQRITTTFSYQHTNSDRTTLFAFEDATRASVADAVVTWTYRVSPFLSIAPKYQFTRSTNRTDPYFANRLNVSGDAGIQGNDQNPVNWGPPALSFASGIESLVDALPASTTIATHLAGVEARLSRGRHNFTFGGDVRRRLIDLSSQQDPRGAFAFTGTVTGSDLADFLLGLPATSSIAFGNADKYFRASSYDAFITDDWRVTPSLSMTVGGRWEYEAPITERRDRLVNLDVTPGFQSAAPVVAQDPRGALTGQEYPDSLLRPDKGGIQPRVALAWRPIPGSSIVVRAGYGIYRNTDVYQAIATLLAQQPPLSTTLSVQRSAETPLTLANGFIAAPSATLNTFAVDPDFKVGYAQNWQLSMQRDLPASLTVTTSYLGAKGHNLVQEFLPNTYPAGAVSPCATCPTGFVYLTSNGRSTRHAGQVQLRRRLRNGLTASVQYTLAKATDNAAAFTGVSLSPSAIAQNWLDLDAEWGPSNFDQRHQIVAQFQYTTGVGVGGGALVSDWWGSLLRGWTMNGQLTTGSGLPLTPRVLLPVAGTGVTGTLRPSLTGADVDDIPDGYYLNPAAYAVPAAGTWGTAGRNSARGPAPFSMNASVSRLFPRGDRFNFEWRLDITNVLNRLTYTTVNTTVGSSQFGLPIGASAPRKIQTRLSVRF